MKNNLAQLRALNASKWAPNVKKGKGGGKPGAIAKKVPAQIIQNGLLGAMAFALEENDAHLSVFKGVIEHFTQLRGKGIDFKVNQTDPKNFFQEISAKPSAELRLITGETMEYLNYLRRFVK